MIKEILNATIIYVPEEFQPFPLELKLNAEYIVKCEILSGRQRLYEIDIFNIPFPEQDANIQEDIFRYKFTDATCKRFKVQGVQPYEGDLCIANFLLWLHEEDIDTADVLNIKMIEFNSILWGRLKLDIEKMEQTISIIEKYFNGNEIDAMREICIFSEFITHKLVEKIERKKVNLPFGSMINKLCNIGKKEKKI